MILGLRSARRVVFATFLCLAIGAAASPQADHVTAKSHRSDATRLHNKEIVKFARVTPTLYRGGQPSLKGLEELRKMNVAIVVDMRSGNRKSEEKVVNKLGMKYVHISWHCPLPTDKPFASFLEVIEQNPGKKVFVHCRLGDDRTGMAVASYRMAEEGWSADEAMNEMRDFGFNSAHHMICPGLAGYEKSFPERLKKDDAFKDLHTHAASATKSEK
jgi:protein tyrosine/serine phosphatase